MPPSESDYTKLRWLMTIAGLVLYVVDIGTDVVLAVQYVIDKHFVWSGLTIVFVLTGMMGTQTFSYAWYLDDRDNVMINPMGKKTVSGMSGAGLASLHIFGLGIFTRYYHLLKTGFHVLWPKTSLDALEERSYVHQSVFGLATDLSMLKLFECFLESVPQLLLQLFIMLESEEKSILQYLCVAFSFFNIGWALVDYRRCLRRSLAHIREMPSGLPTVVYLAYKVLTITAHILSYSLLLILSVYSTVALACLWFLGTVWAHLLRTDFCTHRSLEWFYRAIVGVILLFTFFNVKGQNTKVPMSLYYSFYTIANVLAPVLLTWMKPEVRSATYLLPVTCVIYVGTLLGLVCLVVYYALLHPRGKPRVADEVDGLEKEPETRLRMRSFLQP